MKFRGHFLSQATSALSSICIICHSHSNLPFHDDSPALSLGFHYLHLIFLFWLLHLYNSLNAGEFPRFPPVSFPLWSHKFLCQKRLQFPNVLPAQASIINPKPLFSSLTGAQQPNILKNTASKLIQRGKSRNLSITVDH